MHWKEWLKSNNEQGIWRASKIAKTPISDKSCSCILTLFRKSSDNVITETYATDNEKAASIFFPPKPPSLPPMDDDAAPRLSPLPFNVPQLHQVIRRIERSAPFKAPRNDSIPNIVLKSCVDLIAPVLLTCLQSIIRLKYFPCSWREWTTVILHKPSCDNYTILKAYWPIALYCTMGKIISSVMTDITVYVTVKHAPLPLKLFGGLPGKTTPNSVLYLVHQIKAAWRKGKVVTIIFMDITKTFPNAITE
jgi:hypothetical protein